MSADPLAVSPTGSVKPRAQHHFTHRILVVDDNPSIRESIATLLQGEGYHVLGVENGREALRVLREGYDPSLVLLDMMMPVMDGWDFRVAQRDDPNLAQIPVVVLSAVVNPALEAKKLAAVAGFRKPLDVYALLDFVSQCCPQTR